MGIVNGIRTIDNLIAGSLSGAQLETWLGTGINKAGFIQALNAKGQARAMFESSAALTALIASSIATTAVAASSTAMSVLASNRTAMTSVAASSTAMEIVAASSIAMTAIAASSPAKMAVFNADTALNAIAASATAMLAFRSASQYSVVTWTENGNTPVGISLTGESHIVLGCSRAGTTARTYTFVTRRAGSGISATTPNCLAVSSVTAIDFNVAIPLITPMTVATTSGGTLSAYAGILRCDI